jgi:hypothetical protein
MNSHFTQSVTQKHRNTETQTQTEGGEGECLL